MKICIVGASAGLGRALAETLAARGHDLVLVASDRQDLDPLVQDLSIRYGAKVSAIAVDLRTADPQALRDQIVADLGGLDGLLMVAGFTDPQDIAQLPDQRVMNVLNINMIAPLRLINACEGDLAQGGILVAISSVATMRPRRNNAVYAAAKAGLESLVLSLRHRHASTGLRVTCVRMGFMSTSMTFGQKLPLPAASPEVAAAFVVGAMEKDNGLVYFPGWWCVIAMVMNSLPWVIFRRLNI